MTSCWMTCRWTPSLAIALLLAGCASVSTEPVTPRASYSSPDRPNPIAASTSAPQHCLALAMYWEARGEGKRGMLAVGAVVMNRVSSREFPNSVCAVVKQGGETPPCQFSWWCDGKSDRPRDRTQWQAALMNANHLLHANPSDATGGALFFHSAAIDTPWLRQRQRTARIGGHVFYR